MEQGGLTVPLSLPSANADGCIAAFQDSGLCCGVEALLLLAEGLCNLKVELSRVVTNSVSCIFRSLHLCPENRPSLSPPTGKCLYRPAGLELGQIFPWFCLTEPSPFCIRTTPLPPAPPPPNSSLEFALITL